jgi:hypothetical protein
MQTPKEFDNIISTDLGVTLIFYFLFLNYLFSKLRRVSSVFILASSVYNIWTLYAFVNISPLKV